MSKDECFGQLFPELNHVINNTEVKGEVFSLTVHHKPISKPRLEIEVNQKRWDKCYECDRYQSCYDLSMAKLALYTAVKSTV